MPMKIRIYQKDLNNALLSLNIYQYNWDITDEENTLIPKEEYSDLVLIFTLLVNELRNDYPNSTPESMREAVKTLISLIDAKNAAVY